MTKVRAPVTFDNALSRIAGQIGWPAMAAATGQAERTVRDWSDPDTGRQCTVTAAVALDLAYLAGGGGARPMLETFTLLVDHAQAAAFGDQLALAEQTCSVIKEAAEAERALVRAILPGATAADRATARHEVEDAILEMKAALPLLAEGPPPKPPP
jgi:hypothetical protein